MMPLSGACQEAVNIKKIVCYHQIHHKHIWIMSTLFAIVMGRGGGHNFFLG